jgi:antitoxin component HigA of HigAB toxin-antitoxin module
MKATLVIVENDRDHQQAKALTRAQLAEFLGTPIRVSEIMTGKRELSMSMVRKVRDRFHVSADVLIGPPRLRKGLAA